MITGDKFSTPGVRARIPAYLQNILWYTIETMDVPNKNDLQVFELERRIRSGQTEAKDRQLPSTTRLQQIIRHLHQEYLYLQSSNCTHCTILLAEEH